MISGFSTHTRVFTFGNQSIQLVVPDAFSVQQRYSTFNKQNEHLVFPFWSKVWPAAVGMCEWLAQHPHYINNKSILELAAGLGLPSVFSSLYAKQVYCTDIVLEAVDFAQQSALVNNFSNMFCSILDWNNASTSHCDILLLSDVNYDSAQFDKLYKVIHGFLNSGTTIIISTPQRLMAKPFVEKLLLFCIERDECIVEEEQIQTAVSIFVLKR
ncbi:MAG: methyltransferase [Agriterribacter sp.]